MLLTLGFPRMSKRKPGTNSAEPREVPRSKPHAPLIYHSPTAQPAYSSPPRRKPPEPTNHFRVDWFTPDGLRTWGDGRTFILGTEGTQHMELHGKVGYPFFGQRILDCLNRTETAMTQAHAFKAAELCLQAQSIRATWLAG